MWVYRWFLRSWSAFPHTGPPSADPPGDCGHRLSLCSINNALYTCVKYQQQNRSPLFHHPHNYLVIDKQMFKGIIDICELFLQVIYIHVYYPQTMNIIMSVYKVYTCIRYFFSWLKYRGTTKFDLHKTGQFYQEIQYLWLTLADKHSRVPQAETPSISPKIWFLFWYLKSKHIM